MRQFRFIVEAVLWVIAFTALPVGGYRFIAWMGGDDGVAILSAVFSFTLLLAFLVVRAVKG